MSIDFDNSGRLAPASMGRRACVTWLAFGSTIGTAGNGDAPVDTHSIINAAGFWVIPPPLVIQLLFEHARFALNKRQLNAVAEIASLWRQAPANSVVALQVNGDPRTPGDAQLKLARQRAQALTSAFIRAGIPPKFVKIEAVPYQTKKR